MNVKSIAFERSFENIYWDVFPLLSDFIPKKMLKLGVLKKLAKM